MLIFTSAAWLNESAACSIYDHPKNGSYSFNLSEPECAVVKKSIYPDGPIIPFYLNFPTGEVVDYSRKSSKISVRLYYVSPDYDADAVINDKSPEKTVGNVEIYRSANEEIYVITGHDKNRAIIKNRGYTWLAHRMHKGIKIIYQYEKSLTSFEQADRFVMNFVERILTTRSNP